MKNPSSVKRRVNLDGELLQLLEGSSKSSPRMKQTTRMRGCISVISPPYLCESDYQNVYPSCILTPTNRFMNIIEH